MLDGKIIFRDELTGAAYGVKAYDIGDGTYALAVEGVAGGVAVPVSVAPASAILHGQTVVTTAGTEVPLAASGALTSGVRVKALHGNTGWIYVGANPVTSGTGFVLDAGEEVFIECNALATVYIDSSADGEGVSYIGS